MRWHVQRASRECECEDDRVTESIARGTHLGVLGQPERLAHFLLVERRLRVHELVVRVSERRHEHDLELRVGRKDLVDQRHD